jgi:hypothetical protein
MSSSCSTGQNHGHGDLLSTHTTRAGRDAYHLRRIGDMFHSLGIPVVSTRDGSKPHGPHLSAPDTTGRILRREIRSMGSQDLGSLPSFATDSLLSGDCSEPLDLYLFRHQYISASLTSSSRATVMLEDYVSNVAWLSIITLQYSQV